jgi:Fic family protein
VYEPIFQITPHLLRWLTEATELRLWIQQSIVDVAWVPLLQRDTANRLSHSSTSIEGNPLSLPLVEAVARGEQVGAPAKAILEIENYLAALQRIWAGPAGGRIREEDLLWIHDRLMKEILPREKCGCYKTVPNRVVDSKGHLVYLPPGPEKAGSLVRELLDWLNSVETKTQLKDPVLISAIAHHRLVSIHPFADGNGRMSRLLACWVLYRNGFDTHHLFAIDEYYDANRQAYYDKLQQARDLDDDLSYWLEYVAEGVALTLRKTKARIESLDVQHASARVRLTPKQEELLRILRSKAWISAADLSKTMAISRERMSELLRPLIAANIVLREGRTRATSYRLKPKKPT